MMLHRWHHFYQAGTIALAILTLSLGPRAQGQTRPGTNPGGYYIGNSGAPNRGGATGVYVGGYPSGYQRTDGSGYYIGGNFPTGPSSGPTYYTPEGFAAPYSEGPLGRPPFQRPQPPAAAIFHIRVPANAEIRFDGQKTTKTGTDREFITPPLSPWKAYTYRVWVHWMEKGKPVDHFQQVKFYAGDDVKLDFRQQ